MLYSHTQLTKGSSEHDWMLFPSKYPASLSSRYSSVKSTGPKTKIPHVPVTAQKTEVKRNYPTFDVGLGGCRLSDPGSRPLDVYQGE